MKRELEEMRREMAALEERELKRSRRPMVEHKPVNALFVTILVIVVVFIILVVISILVSSLSPIASGNPPILSIF